jgi:hypothetical protein
MGWFLPHFKSTKQQNKKSGKKKDAKNPKKNVDKTEVQNSIVEKNPSTVYEYRQRTETTN